MWLEPLSQLLVMVALVGANGGDRPARVAGTDRYPAAGICHSLPRRAGRQPGQAAGRGAIARLYGPRGALATVRPSAADAAAFPVSCRRRRRVLVRHSHRRTFGPNAARDDHHAGVARAGRYQTTATAEPKDHVAQPPSAVQNRSGQPGAAVPQAWYRGDRRNRRVRWPLPSIRPSAATTR